MKMNLGQLLTEDQLLKLNINRPKLVSYEPNTVYEFTAVFVNVTLKNANGRRYLNTLVRNIKDVNGGLVDDHMYLRMFPKNTFKPGDKIRIWAEIDSYVKKGPEGGIGYALTKYQKVEVIS
jgi:hypothetical protein